MFIKEKTKRIWDLYGVRELATALLAVVATLTFVRSTINARAEEAVKEAAGEIRVVVLEKEYKRLESEIGILKHDVKGHTSRLVRIETIVGEILHVVKNGNGRHEIRRSTHETAP